MTILSVVSSCQAPLLLQGHVKVEPKAYLQQQNKQLKLSKCLVPSLIAAIVTLSPFCHPQASLGQGVEVNTGATLFNKACIGCHVGGGNIIQPGATLFPEDLARNGVQTEDEIYQITYYGKGRMPGFGQNCTPRGQCTFGARLQDEEIKLLAQFVRSQADQGWKSTENPGN
ncbi:Cytochrome c6 protein [Thalictrum thalictroides]|uniref:Cytochrome c-553 n=1 Tax=Thalictrum thalictroides TaxID=46969 RepID=A0A7J6W8I6_THATH|nr:Cytochrome c6 protein [Thalictrum thalictroides]